MKAQTLLIGMPGGLEWILIIIALAGVIFWIRTIIEIANSQFKDNTSKITWLLVVLLTGILGAIIYVVAGRQSRVAP
jgi:hypothetical protein